MAIIFITGAEGVGKTTLMEYLTEKLPEKEIHDFDEVGVPPNPPLSWRHETTKHWLKISKENEKFQKDTIIIGLAFPSEVKEFSKRNDIHFCLLNINIEERERRLRKREAEKEVIKDLRQLQNLRKEFIDLKNKKIINVSNLTPKGISDKLVEWIETLK